MQLVASPPRAQAADADLPAPGSAEFGTEAARSWKQVSQVPVLLAGASVNEPSQAGAEGTFPANLTDEALMARFCAGGEAAFNLLFDRHAGAIRGLITRLTGNHVLASDLTQATFLSVVRGRGRFVAGYRFKPWLYTIAMNALRDHQRRATREVLSSHGTLPEEEVYAQLPDPGLERAVQAALRKLPEIQRETVVLHQFEGFSFKEIAAMVGLTESAVRVRAHRGYERLRELLGHINSEPAMERR
jgi:RNA polymerase sigma factor (sigma-70 family)